MTLPHIHKLKYTDNNTRLASLDVKNMYTNIPTNKLMEIINLALNNNYTDSCVKWGATEISCVICNEIYFHYAGKFYTQKMGYGCTYLLNYVQDTFTVPITYMCCW